MKKFHIFKNKVNGFTLVELLIVIAIVSVLAVVTITALKPLERFRASRNASRWEDVGSLARAVKLYQVDNNGATPSAITTSLKMLGTSGTGCDVACDNTNSSTSTVDVDVSTDHDFNDPTDYTVSDASLIEVDASDNNLARLTGSGTYSTEKPYVQLATPSALTDFVSLQADHLSTPTTTVTADESAVEYSVLHNGTDKWFDGSSWVANTSGEILSSTSGLVALYHFNASEGNQLDHPSDLDGVASTNLKGMWHFNEGSGQSLVDSSGNNTAGYLGSSSGTTAYDPVWNAGGKFYNTLSFVSSDYATLGNDPDLQISSSISVEAWIKTSINTGYPFIVSKEKSSAPYNGYSLFLSTGYIRFGLVNVSTSGYAVGGSQLGDDNWHYVVGTYDGSNINVYADGKLVASTPYTGGYNSVDNNVLVGNRGAGSGYFNGLIDEVAIYNTALTGPSILNENCDTSTDNANTQICKHYLRGIASDATTSNLNGSIVGPVSTTGQLNEALSFDGGDYIDVGALNLTSNTFTLESWIKPDDIANSSKGIMGKYNGATGGYIFSIYGDKPRLWINTWYTGTSGSIVAGSWQHVAVSIVAVSISSGTATFYVNGVPKGVMSVNAPITSTASFQIGAGGSNWSPFKGSIDEVAIYNTALTSVEVASHYGDGLNGKHSNSFTVLDTNFTSLGLATDDTVSLVAYLISNGSAQASIDDIAINWVQSQTTSSAETTTADCIDISNDLINYLAEIPEDPSTGSSAKTYYGIKKNSTGTSTVEVISCSAENSEDIRVSK